MKHSNPAGIIAGTAFLQLASTICITLRFYTRFWKGQSIIASDWLILVAFVFATGLSVTEFYGVAIKALAHPMNATFLSKDVTGHLNVVKNLQQAIFVISIVALGFIKISVSTLYWNLFAKVKFRRFLLFWIILMVMWTLAFSLCSLLQCRGHFEALSPKDYQKYCRACENSGYVYVGSGSLSDLITLLIPIPIVISMSLPRKQKALVLATFMLGALSVGASIAKGYMYITSMLSSAKQDAGVILTEFSIWNLVEVHIGIVAACGMTLRPILQRILPMERIMAMFGKAPEENRQPKEATLPSFVRSPERLDTPQQEDKPSLQSSVDFESPESSLRRK